MLATQRRAPRELGYRGSQVLAFIRTTIACAGRAPSYAMIEEQLGFSSRANVAHVIRRLEDRGLVSRVGAGRVRRINLPV